MLMLVTVCLCSFLIPLYFMRLIADGRKLRSKLPPLLTAAGEIASAEETLLFKSHYVEWVEPLLDSENPESSGEQPLAS